MKKIHFHLADIGGYGRLAIDATLGVTNLVEAMHHTILRLPLPFGKTDTGPVSGIHGLVVKVLQGSSGLVYDMIRHITALVGGGLDAALGHLQPELDQLHSSRQRAAVISVLNGVLGDHMRAKGNPLTIPMGLRHDGEILELSSASLAAAILQPSGKVLLLLHGHCMNEMQWLRNGHEHGRTLAAKNGHTPLYVRYNSGLHISENGRALAELLEQLLGAWPLPLQELCILGYSMGGLVARSAFYYGAQANHGWMRHAHKLIFIGTPHHGSMLEQAGNLLDVALEASPYSEALARLGKIRSAGTTDLRHGNLRDEDWAGRDRFAHVADPRQPMPLPAGVRCYAIAAMIAKKPGELSGKLLGDGLVPLDSALGRHRDQRRALAFAAGHQQVFYDMAHLGLLDSLEVCAQLQEWIAQAVDATETQ